MNKYQFLFGRIIRDIKAYLYYPLWVLMGKPSPDSHIQKRKRILRIADQYSCDTFLESGTYYGQTINAVKNHFNMALSIELSDSLYSLNHEILSKDPNVQIFFGDSSEKLDEMMKYATGRVLFWLDGHYSGVGTACGKSTSPILAELEAIKSDARKDHCILIDDVRLFNGAFGYPKLETAKEKLLEINSKYQIKIEQDCFIALPPFV